MNPGTLPQGRNPNTNALDPRFQLLFPDTRNSYGVSRQVPLPRGRGEGPAEISLMPAFWGAFRQVESVLASRYRPAASPPAPYPFMPGTTVNYHDKWSLLNHQGAPVHHFEPWQNLPPTVMKRPDRPIRDYWLPGPDGNWGRAGVDDNGDGMVDNYAESGWPRTDDFHYNTAFGDPSDIRGIGAVGHDLVHNLFYMDQGYSGEYTDNPYEHSPQDNVYSDSDTLSATLGSFNTSRRYTIHDLEAMLRIHDSDGKLLSSRLLDAAPASLRGGKPDVAFRRNQLTTHSTHIPVPPTGISTARRTVGVGQWPYAGAVGNIRSPHILDLYTNRLLRGGVPNALIQRELNKIVPWELRHGLKFDVNRPFGNGLDDNHDDVVDDPAEWARGEFAFTSYRSPPTFGPVPFNHRNGGPSNLDPRAVFARHLYCLMMLLAEEGYVQPFLNAAEENAIRTENPALFQEITAQRIAQWAVNVVDFRDADAIMTPFEYDINPFDGWDVDGWVSVGPGPDGAWGVAGTDDDMNMVVDDRSEAGASMSDDVLNDEPGRPAVARQRRVVWGVERPDLMITEVKSMHNVRTKDSDHDDNMQKTLTDMPDPDMTMDQYRVPQGSTFIELYCPANRFAHDPRMPPELYDFDGNLDLNRIAPGMARNPMAP